MTNYERIKAMSAEEMAEMLLDENETNFDYCTDGCKFYCYYAPHCYASDTRKGCIEARVRWLESEVDT